VPADIREGSSCPPMVHFFRRRSLAIAKEKRKEERDHLGKGLPWKKTFESPDHPQKKWGGGKILRFSSKGMPYNPSFPHRGGEKPVGGKGNKVRTDDARKGNPSFSKPSKRGTLHRSKGAIEKGKGGKTRDRVRLVQNLSIGGVF